MVVEGNLDVGYEFLVLWVCAVKNCASWLALSLALSTRGFRLSHVGFLIKRPLRQLPPCYSRSHDLRLDVVKTLLYSPLGLGGGPGMDTHL